MTKQNDIIKTKPKSMIDTVEKEKWFIPPYSQQNHQDKCRQNIFHIDKKEFKKTYNT